MMPNLMFLILLLLFSSVAIAGPNHAILDAKHSHVAERFIEKNLKADGQYNYNRANEFLKFLKANTAALRSDIYETTIIEVMDMRLESSSDAKVEAAKQMEAGENNLIYTYEKYIIPKMEAITKLIADGHPESEIDAAVDDFIEFYHVYYIPEKPRNNYRREIKWHEALYNQLGYTFQKDTNKVEANNLVASGYESQIANCLGYTPKQDVLLQQVEIELLKDCQFDISLLNPIKNPFFNNLSNEQREERKTDFLHLFPKGNERFKFEFLIYTGLGSPKFVGSFYKTINGERKKVTFKVKIGQELHVDPAASMLGKLVGLHQDHSKYYEKMRFYLREGQTVDEFIAQFSRKYTGYTRSISAFIIDRSPKHAKEQWFEIQDLSIEIRDPDERRLSPFDSWGWDLPNRREHRGILLWYGFLAAKDLKPGNHVAKLRERDGKTEIIYSPQDVGYSLGSMVDIRYPTQFIGKANGRTVNYFMPSFMSYGPNSVRIFWRDGHHVQGRFYSTTYSDLKWMARKIAKLSLTDIEYGIRAGGFPEPIVKLYTLKLGHRLNEIIRGFDLEDEFPLLKLPNLKDYNDLPYVKNGVLVARGFDGHFELSSESPRTTLANKWGHEIIEHLPLEKLYSGLRASMGIGMGADLTANLVNLKKNGEKPFKFETLFGGIKFSIERSIKLNDNYYARSSSEMGMYIVKDTVSAAISLEGKKALDILSHLPLSVTGNLKIYEKSYSHFQTAESFQSAVLAPIRVFRYIRQGLVGTSVDLEKGDVFKQQDGFGFGIGMSGKFELKECIILCS